MPVDTSDVRSNPNEQIEHAARIIGKSKDCRKVFEAIHKGKRRIKKVSELVLMTGLGRMRVLQEAGKLSNNKIIKKTKLDGELAYEKDDFFSQNKNKILRLAGNKKALEKYPTKRNPKSPIIYVKVPVPRGMSNIKQISIDDIESFAKVKDIKFTPSNHDTLIPESVIKRGLQKILGEEGTFQDWGGETDDLFSTRMVLSGKRVNVAFGLKGKGTSGKLTPKRMGKHGDQVQRLFRAPADVFMVQHLEQIDESIIEQMKAFATVKSMYENKIVYYGIIDGQDTCRLISAYPDCFGTSVSD